MKYGLYMGALVLIAANVYSKKEEPLKAGKHYLPIIEKAIASHDVPLFFSTLEQYLAAPKKCNPCLCGVLSNHPDYLRVAIQEGLVIGKKERYVLLATTTKKRTIDILIESGSVPQPIWLACTINIKIAQYLLDKGLNINEKMSIEDNNISYTITPLVGVLFHKTSKEQKEYYIFLRKKGANPTFLNDFLEMKKIKYCEQEIDNKKCKKYTQQKELFDQYEEKAARKGAVLYY